MDIELLTMFSQFEDHNVLVFAFVIYLIVLIPEYKVLIMVIMLNTEKTRI